MRKRTGYGLVILFVGLLGFLTCHSKDSGEATDTVLLPDFPQIKAKGEITAITLYSSTSYFQYKMLPMGYDYELINAFAQTHGLKLNIKVAENVTKLQEMLEEGAGDIIAYPIPITNPSKNQLIYCGREDESSQVLVQRANKGDTLLKDVTQLIGKTIYVKHGTKYKERLENLNLELGGGIHIQDVEKDTVTTEDLIEMVSKGMIGYTVSDDKIAKLNKTYYWNIDTRLKISFQQRSSWAVRKSSPLLAEAIDKWAQDQSSKANYRAVTKRYFELSKQPVQPVVATEIKNGVISPYDPLFKKYAVYLGWDWRLIASISYQESHFDTTAISWAGAEGLMGIMPNTARRLGVSPHELKNPEIGIKTGIECLRLFNKSFSTVTDPMEKIKLTLASYNAGIGHVYDAQKLAKKYGKDPDRWDGNVEEYIRLKNDPAFYNDPVVKHGYLRGSETYRYVREVLERFEYFKKMTR